MYRFPEYEQYDALGLAELVNTAQISSLELVEAAVERIETHQRAVNAVVQTMYDEAREIAKTVVPQPDLPFNGVPFLLKDLLAAYAGVPLRNGSRFFSSYIPDSDSPIVERQKAAGLITVGKTNTPELGITPVTEPELFGPTNNPWDLSRTVGGSSGGAAAAVAARLVPMAHGGDGGGSIRIPASCCGVFGLKPTYGRNPRSTTHESWQRCVSEHVLTRSVRDSAAMLDATASGDFWPPARPFLQEVDTPPGRLRIAYTAEPFLGDAVDDDCYQALMDTVQLCQELGHEMVEAYPIIDGPGLARAFLTMLTGEIRADIIEAEDLLGRKATAQDFERDTWALNLLGKQVTAGEFALAMHTFQRTAQLIHEFFNDYDVLLTPTLAQPPVVTGSMLTQGAEAVAMDVINRFNAGKILQVMKMIDTAAGRVFQFTPYTMLFNVSGNPAMSVPLHWNKSNLPIGMQFAGRFADEATLFRLAGQLEKAQPWFDRLPPLLREAVAVNSRKGSPVPLG